MAYLEQLKEGATVGDVFDDLFGKVDGVIGQLNAERIRLHGNKNSTPTIPNTPLRFTWGVGRMGAITGGPVRAEFSHSTGIEVRVDFDVSVKLVGRTILSNPVSEERLPHSVSATRGQELGYDFRLSYDDETARKLHTRISGMGYWGTGKKESEQDFIGSDLHTPASRVDRLFYLETMRLEQIGTRVQDGLEAIELLREGHDPREVVEALGTLIRPELSLYS